MRHPITIILIALPLFGAPKPFSGDLMPVERPVVSLIDVVIIAKIVHCECRGEPIDGRIAVIDVCRNYAKSKNLNYQQLIERKFVCAGEPDSASIALSAQILRREPSHRWTHFFNPSTATNEDFVEYGLGQCGEMIHSQYFF